MFVSQQRLDRPTFLPRIQDEREKNTSSYVIPIGIQNFEKIREGGYVYVDKTDLIYNIVETGGYYFLSRPRRFGKSLLVSTLEAYFQGKKELFEGLAVENLEQDWNTYPVLHLDLSRKTYRNENDLEITLDQYLSQ